MKKLWVLLVTVVVLCGFCTVKERIITGKIISAEDGTALPGVSILLKGTTIGTSSASNGYYQISAPLTDATLVFSFIGLQPQEVKVGSSSILNVSMRSDPVQLSELVVQAICYQRIGTPPSPSDNQ